MTRSGSLLNNFNAMELANSNGYSGPHVEDEQLPQLSRLCKDFGLHVLPWREKISHAEEVGANGYCYRLATAKTEIPGKIDDFQFLTPPFKSMSELETYVFDNMVDILHDYLFSEGEV